MNWDLNYGELAKDKDFFSNCERLKENLMELQTNLDQLLEVKKQYDKLSTPDQIELDLFYAFSLTCLQWVNLRINGIDPTQHPIKDELKRIKDAMKQWQEYKDRDKRPTVNIDAAKRFIRSGLYDPDQPPAKNRKIKFEDNESE